MATLMCWILLSFGTGPKNRRTAMLEASRLAILRRGPRFGAYTVVTMAGKLRAWSSEDECMRISNQCIFYHYLELVQLQVSDSKDLTRLSAFEENVHRPLRQGLHAPLSQHLRTLNTKLHGVNFLQPIIWPHHTLERKRR